MSKPLVSVVVPYYRDQDNLDRMLVALTDQSLADFEVVITDDGSPTPPVVGQRPYPVRVVRQEDRGFRAAAARNLGARHAVAPVLVFLDGDMTPEPGFLVAMYRAVTESTAPTLCVGRRRHGSSQRPLGEPSWLREGYASTSNLVEADDTSYRFVISAVMALPAAHFARLGGFADFTGYGGEDWELAHRWRLSGGLLRHVPEAVAWHDGPDFAGRGDGDEQRSSKDAEALRLAPLVSVPGARDPRLLWAVPDIAVRLDATGLTPAQALAVMTPLVHGSDCHLWVEGLDGAVAAALQDPRIHVVDADHVSRPPTTRWVVEVLRPGVLGSSSLAAVVASVFDHAPHPPDPGQAALSLRHAPTGRTWHLTPPEDRWGPLPEPSTSLEELWRGLADGDRPGTTILEGDS